MKRWAELTVGEAMASGRHQPQAGWVAAGRSDTYICHRMVHLRYKMPRRLVRCADLQILIHSSLMKERVKKWRRAHSRVVRSCIGNV